MIFDFLSNQTKKVDSPTQNNHLLHATNGASGAPVADLLIYGGMHTLNGSSLGQFGSNTLARSSNLHNPLTTYPASFLSGAHKPLNYTTTNFNTYHQAPGTHHPYSYTTVLGGHRSASGQSLPSGIGTTATANNQLYQTSAYPSSFVNAHGPIVHHLPPNNQNSVLGALQTAPSNHPLHFTTSTLSTGSALPTTAHPFVSLPRTAQSNIFFFFHSE